MALHILKTQISTEEQHKLHTQLMYRIHGINTTTKIDSYYWFNEDLKC